jgi:hypothetical protein
MKVLDELGLSSLFRVTKEFITNKTAIANYLPIANNKKINTTRVTSHQVGDRLIYSKGLMLECIESGVSSSKTYDFDTISSIAFVMPENGTITITSSATYPHIVQYAKKNSVVYTNPTDKYWSTADSAYFRAVRQNYLSPFTVQQGDGVVFYINVPENKTAGDYLTITILTENLEEYDLNESSFAIKRATKSFIVPFDGNLTITSSTDYDNAIKIATSDDEAFTGSGNEYWIDPSGLMYDLTESAYIDSIPVEKDEYVTFTAIIEKSKTIDEVITTTLSDGEQTVIL